MSWRRSAIKEVNDWAPYRYWHCVCVYQKMRFQFHIELQNWNKILRCCNSVIHHFFSLNSWKMNHFLKSCFKNVVYKVLVSHNLLRFCQNHANWHDGKEFWMIQIGIVMFSHNLKAVQYTIGILTQILKLHYRFLNS